MLKILNWMLLIFSLVLVNDVYANESNTSTSENTIMQLAEQGNSLVQAKIGAMYLLGKEGKEQDDKKAAEWMLKAANQGFLEAQVIVAAMYDRGMGMEMDVHKATAWYEKAAAQGHKPSLAILGRNEIAKGGIAFDYKRIRLGAAKQIPAEYAKQILRKK